MNQRDRDTPIPPEGGAPDDGREQAVERMLHALGRDIAEESTPDPRAVARMLLPRLEAAMRQEAGNDSESAMSPRRAATVLDLAYGQRRPERERRPAAPASSRRAWLAAACLLVVAAVVGWGIVRGGAAPAGRIQYAEGGFADAFQGAGARDFAPGSEFATGGDGFAIARMDDRRVTLSLAAETRFLAVSATEARVSSGEAWISLPPNSGAFTVSTPHGRVEVLGTEFGVAVEPSGTRVALARGSVRVVGNDASERIMSPGDRVLLAATGSRLLQSADVGQRAVDTPPWAKALAERAQIAVAARYLPSGHPPTHSGPESIPGKRP